MSLAINPKLDGTLELKNTDTAKTLMTFDAQGRQTNPNGLAYVGGAILVDGLSATFTNATNNINATGIGVGVEVGDVIQVSGSANNDTEFTVEVITDTDNVIVNQAHAGGTTSKSLVDETATVTIKLLCKWYLAPPGLGQGWVDVTGSRALGVPYPNTTKRPFIVSVTCNVVGNHTLKANTGNTTILGAGSITGNDRTYIVVKITHTEYSITPDTGLANATLARWSELR